MIIAAGLTPAWQQIMRFETFRAGEVNRALEVHRCASGKVLNVGIALAHLGAPSETISLLGGATGDQIDREFNALGIRRRWIRAHWSTRVCTTILDAETGRATELVENAGPVTAEELEQFRVAYVERAAQAGLVILTGSLPAGTPPEFFRDLLSQTHCPAILDIRGDELIAALNCRPLLVKPNREELARTLGRDLSDDRQLHAAMQELNDRGATWVLITQGAGPAWARTHDRLFRLVGPKVSVINPIGSGDCLAAGFAWGIFDGQPPLEAIRLGLAAAAENAKQLLPARLDPELVTAGAATVMVEPV